MFAKKTIAAAALALLVGVAVWPSRDAMIVEGPSGSTIIGTVDVDAVPAYVWDSPQLLVDPAGGLVVGARFLPWGSGTFELPEIDVPTLDDAIGPAGVYTSSNSAWGFLSWQYERGTTTVPALLDLLIAEVAKRGCSGSTLEALRRWAEPRVRGWVGDKENAVG